MFDRQLQIVMHGIVDAQLGILVCWRQKNIFPAFDFAGPEAYMKYAGSSVFVLYTVKFHEVPCNNLVDLFTMLCYI